MLKRGFGFHMMELRIWPGVKKGYLNGGNKSVGERMIAIDGSKGKTISNGNSNSTYTLFTRKPNRGFECFNAET